MGTEKRTCCVFGHRKVERKDELKQKLAEVFEMLINDKNVDTFFVGSKSEFDELCREILVVEKEKFPNIKRIYVRAEYPDISSDYEKYLLENCEETYYPERLRNAGKAVYVERNCYMIDNSDFCVVYCMEGYLPSGRKNNRRDLFDYKPQSGTCIAYKYAVHKKRIIINLVEDVQT